MITNELLPLLAARGLSTARIGLWGWSLGGYGALLLASALGPQHVAAAVAASPALWDALDATGPGTFDDEADFTANNVSSRHAQFESVPLRIDCGRDDPFATPVRRLRAALQPTPAGGLSAGCHDEAFWTRRAAAQIDFSSSGVEADPTRSEARSGACAAEARSRSRSSVQPARSGWRLRMAGAPAGSDPASSVLGLEACQLGSVSEVELLEDPREVGLDRLAAHDELGRNSAVGEAAAVPGGPLQLR